MRAMCAIVGGTPEERLSFAVRLRRNGVSVFIETRQRKKARATKCARSECVAGGLHDLDSPTDRWYLGRNFAFRPELRPVTEYRPPVMGHVEKSDRITAMLDAGFHPETVMDTLGVTAEDVGL